VKPLDPDLIVCIGARHGGGGGPDDYAPFADARQVIALGSDVETLKNIPGLDVAILADERRSLERLSGLVESDFPADRYDERRTWAREQGSTLRSQRRIAVQPSEARPGVVRPLTLLDAIDTVLEEAGGGLVTTEQFAVPLDCVQASDTGNNVYIRPAGGSEGYGIGAAVGAKLAAPDKPVVGIVGDGSLYYADSGMWTAAHHRIPVLYVITNNGAYGIVAGAFGRAEGQMSDTGVYAGVVLDGIDPVKIAEAFGVEAAHLDDESKVDEAIKHGLEIVNKEGRPYLLNVHLPLGLPPGGTAAEPYKLVSR
jgi:benzoylformate decarboxylase